MKKRLCFIGIHEHAKTGSSAFLTSLLSEEWDLQFYLEEDFETKPDFDADRLVFWQRPPSRELLPRLPASRVILVPMYDEARNYRRSTIASWAPFRIVSFCRSMHESLLAGGLDSKYFQYFPEPRLESPRAIPEPKLFCWIRESCYINESIPPSLARSLLQGFDFSLHIHSETGGGGELEAVARQVTRSSWFSDKAEMLHTLEACSLYLTPRESEGIGMSFLDAMSSGLAVIAADNPTMNEYIRHGDNGYLFNLTKSAPLDFSRLDAVRRRSLETCAEGFARWTADRARLLEFVGKDESPASRRTAARVFHYRSLKLKDPVFALKRFARKALGL